MSKGKTEPEGEGGGDSVEKNERESVLRDDPGLVLGDDCELEREADLGFIWETDCSRPLSDVDLGAAGRAMLTGHDGADPVQH